jgi:hypothetical protein
MAPPVSLPTSVTSSRSRAARKSPTSLATRRRALGVGVHRDAVRAQREVGRDAARLALEQRGDLAPQRPVDQQAMDEDHGRALAGVAVVDGPLRERDLGHVVLAIV